MSTVTRQPAIALEDRLAVHDLVAEYSFRADTKDYDGLSALFAVDGVWDEQVLGVPRCEGRDAIHGLFSSMNQADIPYVFHTIGNERLTACDGATASGTCHLHALGSINGNPLDFLGYYDDEYVKVDGRWLFANRVLVAIGPVKKVM